MPEVNVGTIDQWQACPRHTVPQATHSQATPLSAACMSHSPHCDRSGDLTAEEAIAHAQALPKKVGSPAWQRHRSDAPALLHMLLVVATCCLCAIFLSLHHDSC